jgi:hypothetical protein
MKSSPNDSRNLRLTSENRLYKETLNKRYGESLAQFRFPHPCDSQRVYTERPIAKNEKATRQLGGLFFQGRIVPTEGKVRQNFLAKSYEPKNRGVKRFLLNKCLCFQ